MSKVLHSVLGKYWQTPTTTKRKVVRNQNVLSDEKKTDLVETVQIVKKYKDIAVQTERNHLFEKHFLNYHLECEKLDFFKALNLQPKDQDKHVYL